MGNFLLIIGDKTYRRDIDPLQSFQRKASKMIQEMENLPFEDRLGELRLFSLEKGMLQRDLRAAFQYLRGTIRKKETDSLAESVVIGLEEVWIVYKKIFTVRVDDSTVRVDRLPRVVVDDYPWRHSKLGWMEL